MLLNYKADPGGETGEKEDCMKKITFAPVMDGWRRKVVVKDKVNGYSHTVSVSGVHYFRRADIGYIISNVDGAATFEKVDYSTCSSLDVKYDDFHKFVDIQKVGQIGAGQTVQKLSTESLIYNLCVSYNLSGYEADALAYIDELSSRTEMNKEVLINQLGLNR